MSNFPTSGEWGGFKSAQSLEKQGLGEDGELLERCVETANDNDDEWGELPREPLIQPAPLAHGLACLLETWVD